MRSAHRGQRPHLPRIGERENRITSYNVCYTKLLRDFGFGDLFRRYAQLAQVNEAVARRIRAASSEDATVNAIVLLDALAHYLPNSLEESLEALEPLFHGYLRKDQ